MIYTSKDYNAFVSAMFGDKYDNHVVKSKVWLRLKQIKGNEWFEAYLIKRFS